jgi:hypothetical protein
MVKINATITCIRFYMYARDIHNFGLMQEVPPGGRPYDINVTVLYNYNSKF